MANAVTLNTAGIVAFISLARAMFWTAYFSNATLAAKASVQRTAIPTTTMEAHPVSTVICSDDCFRVDSSRHSRCCQSVLRSVRHLYVPRYE
ncbi:hypothetical protein DOTSEDRAFT_75335 [Dothistroma septosporum NZE10]|uniref:Uncharacterized protein n=1 Tax=Dothistroma septosporum (strain NZE10 / CBS 128990) TaxID=675120 RepID=M2XJL7_DOTSN|nr:hypothetical protein DOTSEDRAFT_75335 [Dothistroma septosporum NZE10]